MLKPGLISSTAFAADRASASCDPLPFDSARLLQVREQNGDSVSRFTPRGPWQRADSEQDARVIEAVGLDTPPLGRRYDTCSDQSQLLGPGHFMVGGLRPLKRVRYQLATDLLECLNQIPCCH